MQVFPTIDQANEVLEYYENFLLRCKDIIYLAVVKKPKGYGFEIGIKFSAINTVKRMDISPLKTYLGDFDIHEIPKFFPVPSVFKIKMKYFLKERTMALTQDTGIEESPSTKYPNEFFYPPKIKYQSNTKWIKDYLNIKNELNDPNRITSESNTTNSFSVQSKFGVKGTLGGVFKLLQFPTSYFGITNQHVFSHPKTKLGDTVYDGNRNVIGQLFWTAKDIRKEVAFVKLNEIYSKKYLEGKKAMLISKPQIGMRVYHNGFATHGGSSDLLAPAATIHSINATIRIFDANSTHGLKIYKNQTLIENYATDGDSGSLVLNNKRRQLRAIGLNFGRTFERNILGTSEIKTFTVANDINNIFNKYFNEKQEVLDLSDSIEPGLVNTTLVSIFKIDNFIY